MARVWWAAIDATQARGAYSSGTAGAGQLAILDANPWGAPVPNVVLPYLAYLFSALLMLAAFVAIYTRVTRFDEWTLIREGNVAAALSLGGALLGFSCTLAFSIALHATWQAFLAWALAALAMQVVAYGVVARLLRGMNQAIHQGNAAMGGLMGAVSLGVGVVNAACLT